MLCSALGHTPGATATKKSGSHRTFAHPKKSGIVVVPIHAGRTIPPGTLKSIIDSLGLTIDEFRRLL